MITMRILITCALPYVNNVPHIGNIAGSHLPADIFARYCRLVGHDVVFIGGSDEHGTPTEVASAKIKITPKELCDKYYSVHKKIYEWLDISYDNFSRTSRDIHHRTTKAVFQKIYENGYVSEGNLKLPYCINDNRFLPDRYIEGICPQCSYKDARGDQCERCSTLLNPDELKQPRCAICGHKPIFKNTKHLFLNLDKLEGELNEWIRGNNRIWSNQVIKLALGWINEGLNPRCITRNIKWGVKVPIDGYEDKVFYVWFDAPIGYISATKEWAKENSNPSEWKKYWKSKESRIFHFIGKDNIPFHTIFWPGMLMANGDYSLPYRVAGLQYLNYEGGKISKSKERGIFCENLNKCGLSSDIWRFYLALLIPEINDTEWKWGEFKDRVNNDLIANLGNFIFRTLSFIQNNFKGQVPKVDLGQGDIKVLDSVKVIVEDYRILMEDIKLRDGLKKILELSDIGNKYFQQSEPWKTIKSDPIKSANTLYVCANLCYDLAVMMSPFLPKSSNVVSRQLGVKLNGFHSIGNKSISSGQKITNVTPIFPKLMENDIDNLKKITTKPTKFREMFQDEISYEKFKKIDLRVGKIVKVENVGGLDNILKIWVNSGSDEKLFSVDLRGKYPSESLIGKDIVFVNNLKPSKDEIIDNTGSIMLAIDEDTISIVQPDRKMKSGSRIR